MFFQFLVQLTEEQLMRPNMDMKKDPRQMIWVGLLVLGLLIALAIADYVRRRNEQRKLTRKLLEEVSKCGLNHDERLIIAEMVMEYEVRQPSSLLDSVKTFDSFAQREVRKVLQENMTWAERQARLKSFDGIRRKILAHHGLDPLRPRTEEQGLRVEV